MAGTKRGFMYAGGILAIIVGAMFVFGALIAFAARSVIDTNFVTRVIEEINRTATTAEEMITASEENIALITKLARNLTLIGGVAMVAFAVVNILFGVKVINLGRASSDKKGCVITLLVFSVLCGNFLTVAFMIVALCLKFNNTTAKSNPFGKDDVQTIDIN